MQAENLLRQLPQVNRLLELPDMAALIAAYGRGVVTAELRSVLNDLRQDLIDGSGTVPDQSAIVARLTAALQLRDRPKLRRVINATGIVLHTNLGRAPMAAAAVQAIADMASGYCNLEYDLASGARGSRMAAVEPLLCEITGAEAALAVNNGAAAVLLALSALASGGEVVVSRGELVEIGGGFRIPEVISQGGARLVEVGATNKTRLDDYRKAITPQSRVLLKVHQSNFRTIGFTAEVSMAELAGLAHQQGLIAVADLGSGVLDMMPGVLEPTLSEAMTAGIDLVICSGDKLLGGPQAGLILGSKAALEPLRKHPLLRAVRLDKLQLAALEATLRLHRDQPEAIPVRRMIGQSAAELQARAEALQAMLGHGTIIISEAHAGGGTLPEQVLASRALALAPTMGLEAAAAVLREVAVPVIGRIHQGQLLMDMFCLRDDDLADLTAALRAILP